MAPPVPNMLHVWVRVGRPRQPPGPSHFTPKASGDTPKVRLWFRFRWQADTTLGVRRACVCASLLRTATPTGEAKGERATRPGLEKGRGGPRLAPRNPASSVLRAPSRTARHRLGEPACARQAERPQPPPRDEKAPGKIKDTVQPSQLFECRPAPCLVGQTWAPVEEEVCPLGARGLCWEAPRVGQPWKTLLLSQLPAE